MNNFKWYVALALVVISMQFPAKADYVNLEGGDIIGESQVCIFRGQIRACVLVEKDKKRHQVVADQKRRAVHLLGGNRRGKRRNGRQKGKSVVGT